MSLFRSRRPEQTRTTESTSSSAPPSDRVPAAAQRFMGKPFRTGFLLTFGGLVAIALGMALTDLSTVWVYVAFALFIALGLDPVVRLLERRGLSRAWSIVIVIVGFAAVLAGVLWLIIPTVVRQITQFVKDLPATIDAFQQSDFYTMVFDQFGDQVTGMIEDVENFLIDPNNIAAIGGGVLQVGAGIATGLSGVLIVIVLSLYFLASLGRMKRAFYRLAPARNRSFIAEITEEITASVGSYLMGMVILAFFNAVVTFILYAALQLPFPLLMAVVAFCLTIIPLVGTVAFWVIGTAFALFTSPLAALIFGVLYLVYMQVEAYVLTPRVMNRAISVPGSLVVIGALVGGTLMGLLGALVAIPVTASILLIIKKVWIPRQDAKR